MCFRPGLLRNVMLLYGLLQVAGCALPKPHPEADAFARGALAMIERGDSAGLSHLIDQSLVSSAQWTKWLALRDSLQVLNPDTLELIEFQALTMDGRYSISLTYQLHGPTRWGLATVPVERRARGLVLMGLRLEPLAASVKELNRFTLGGKSWRHYVILTLALVSVLLSFASAFLVIRTQMPRRWLWAVIALLGLGQIGINWTSGEVFVNLLRLQLFAASCVRPGRVGPWIIALSLPVGAIWALWRRHIILQRSTLKYPPGDAA